MLKLLLAVAEEHKGGVVPDPACTGGMTCLLGDGMLCGSCQKAAGRVHPETLGMCSSGGQHRRVVCRNP